jgi:8-hydroxy-5-deazaflavin:NADPH oxidoreductase
MSKVAVLGSGGVGDVLGSGLLARGHEVKRGTRDASKLGKWLAAAGERASVDDFAAAARWCDFAVLAVKGTAAESVIAAVGDALDDKLVLDATNPIADAPPREGVLSFFTGPNDSLMERLQEQAPRARFVKCFSCVGAANMVDPDFGGVRPTMFIAGDHEEAKAGARALLEAFGWDAEDCGKAIAARAIEPLCILWCIPGFARNQWTHAFKLLTR